MAKNTGKGFRLGAVKGRSQAYNPRTGLWGKRSAATGQYMDNKTTGGKYKGISRDK